MWVQSLGQEDPLEEGMETHSIILVWRIPCTEEHVGYGPQNRKESDATEGVQHTHAFIDSFTGHTLSLIGCSGQGTKYKSSFKQRI